jgi:hypothetical protein
MSARERPRRLLQIHADVDRPASADPDEIGDRPDHQARRPVAFIVDPRSISWKDR